MDPAVPSKFSVLQKTSPTIDPAESSIHGMLALQSTTMDEVLIHLRQHSATSGIVSSNNTTPVAVTNP